MNEEWRTIKGFSDYEVSSMGRVRRIIDSRCGSLAGKLLSLSPAKVGYSIVQLWDNGKPKKIYVHQLVLEAFAEPRPEGHVCNHKDCTRTNNRIGNLEWISQSGNVAYAYSLARKIPVIRRGETNPQSKLKEGEVWLIKRLLHSKKVTQKTIGRMFRTSQAHISLIATGQQWSHVKYP